MYTLQTIYALKKGRSIGDPFDYFELLNSFKNPDADVYVFPFQIISVIFSQYSNAYSPIEVTFDGMVILVRELHFENA